MNYTSQYSIIQRPPDYDISPAHSLDDIPEASAEEEQAAEMAAAGLPEAEDMELGYNVIKQENMDGYISEASSDEEGVADEGVRGAGGDSAGKPRMPSPTLPS